MVRMGKRGKLPGGTRKTVRGANGGKIFHNLPLLPHSYSPPLPGIHKFTLMTGSEWSTPVWVRQELHKDYWIVIIIIIIILFIITKTWPFVFIFFSEYIFDAT